MTSNTMNAFGLRALLLSDQHARGLALRGERVSSFGFATQAELGKLEWDRSLPTLHATRSIWDPHPVQPPKLNDARTTWEKILQVNPLMDIDSVTNGQFVIAGGMVLSKLVRPYDYGEAFKFTAPDIDLFFVKGALQPDEAIEKLLRELRQKLCLNVIRAMAETVVELVTEDAALKDKAKFQHSERLKEKWCDGFLRSASTLEGIPTEMSFRGVLERSGLFKEYRVKDEVFVLPVFPPEIVQGLDAESAWLVFFRKTLGSKLLRMSKGPTFTCSRNRNAVSIAARDPVLERTYPTIQIILRAYDYPEHIPLGFDLGSCAVALQFYDGNPVLFTSKFGRLALLTGYNVIDPTRVSPSFQRRLRKYFERGFGIIFPDLDLDRVPKDNLKYNLAQVIVMPSIAFSVKRITGNKMYFSDFHHTWGWCNGAEDYGPTDILSSTTARHNLRMAREGDLNFLHLVQKVESPVAILTALPHMEISDIINYYEKLQQEIWHKGKLNLGLFKNTFAVSTSEDGEDLPTLELADFIESDDKKTILRDAIEAREKAMIRLWTTKISDPEYTKMVWMTKNAASQAKNYGSFVNISAADAGERKPLFTSSVQPAFMTAQEWYGDYYRGAPTKAARVEAGHAAGEAVRTAWLETAQEEAAAGGGSSLGGVCAPT